MKTSVAFFCQCASLYCRHYCSVVCCYQMATNFGQISDCYQGAFSLIARAQILNYQKFKFPLNFTLLDYVISFISFAAIVLYILAYHIYEWPRWSEVILLYYWSALLVKMLEIRCLSQVGPMLFKINRLYLTEKKGNAWMVGKKSFMRSISMYNDTVKYCIKLTTAYSNILLVLVLNVFLTTTTSMYFCLSKEYSTTLSISCCTSPVMSRLLALYSLLATLDSSRTQVSQLPKHLFYLHYPRTNQI